MNRLRSSVVVILAVASSVLAGCATAPTVSAVASPSASAAAGNASPAPTCTDAENAKDPTASYSASRSSAYADQVRNRGYIVVGVSADTRLLGAVDTSNPNVFKGFDIDVAKAVATALWGGNGAERIRYKVINAAQRIPQLQKEVADGGVDMVVRAFTITCARWKQIAFSTQYYSASQKILVPFSAKEPTSVDQIKAGSKVCAPTASTSIETIKAKYKQFQAVEVANHTDCVALFQQGKVDAITGDDVILAGFKDQDPFGSFIVDAKFGDPQPYGVGLNRSHPDFVQYVNAVLEDFRKSEWHTSYERYLKAAFNNQDATPPPPVYGRPVGS